MSEDQNTEIQRLKKINSALMGYVERSTDQQGNAYSLFQTAINLEGQIRLRTEELTETLNSLEQSNHQLKVAKESAETANLSKTRFLAAASHDLLQPLNAAHLMMSSLFEMQSSAESRQLARSVESSLNTIDDLLRSLLDISKLDAGVVRPNLKNFRLQELFNSLESDFAPLAQHKNLQLRFHPTRRVVCSDKTLLRRVLQNLISNALRYTHEGGVIVGCRNVSGSIGLSVIDSGVGIEQSRFTRIFEEFHRGKLELMDGSGIREGIGLGLSIVERTVRTLGHQLKFDSKPEMGSIFQVILPEVQGVELREDTEITSMDVSRLQGVFEKKILVIENDTVALKAMESLLSRWHCEVVATRKLSEALSWIGQKGWLPDVVIADQHLDNGERGTTSIQAIREKLKHGVPAVIVTADPTEDLKKICECSSIELMRKPVKPAQLRALLAHIAVQNLTGVQTEHDYSELLAR